MSHEVTREALWARLSDLLREVKGVDESAIREDAQLGIDLQLESIAFVEITVALEEEFDVQIDPLEVLERRDLGDIVAYLSEIANVGRSDLR